MWKVQPKQFICQRLNIIIALTASFNAKELALRAYKLEYIKLEFIESPPIRSKTSITFYNSLHSSNHIKIFICTLHDIYINVLLRTFESWLFKQKKRYSAHGRGRPGCSLSGRFHGGKLL